MRRRDVLRLPMLAAVPARDGLTLGAYSSPKPFWDRGHRLDAYGINAVAEDPAKLAVVKRVYG